MAKVDSFGNAQFGNLQTSNYKIALAKPDSGKITRIVNGNAKQLINEALQVLAKDVGHMLQDTDIDTKFKKEEAKDLWLENTDAKIYSNDPNDIENPIK